MVDRTAVANELTDEFFGSKAGTVFGPIKDQIASLTKQLNPQPQSPQKFNEELVRTLENIGVFLGNGNDGRVKSGLQQLEDGIETNLKMNLKVSPTEKCPGEQLTAATTYFKDFKTRYDKKLQPQNDDAPVPQTRSPYSKLLTTGLQTVEVQNGFSVTQSGKAPVYVGRLSDQSFITASQSGQAFKDLVSPQHGEFTHRIQWYLVMSGKLSQSANQTTSVLSLTGANGGLVFKLINLVPRLWDYLFDRVNGGEPGASGADDYRCPELLLADLINNRKVEYPLLSAILDARQQKRTQYNKDYESRKDYVTRKLYLCTYKQIENNLEKKQVVDGICETNHFVRN